MIFFFKKTHKIQKQYSQVLIEKVREYIEEKYDFYDDFKYLRQKYGYQIHMYDSDYAIYEHSMIIKNQIESLLEKNKLYILRPPVDMSKNSNYENKLPF